MQDRLKAAIYCRVSTDDQTADNQFLALTRWAGTRDYIVRETYLESESAWRDGHQRELSRLISDAKRGRFSVVLVWSLDRLSRQGARHILELVHNLGRVGVKVLSYQEPWTDAPGELGELLFALTGWVARMESERRSERTKAGLARTVAQGTRLGRPPGSRDARKRKRRYHNAVPMPVEGAS